MTLAAAAARAVLQSLIRGYRWFVSPMLGVNCRFAPSCSEYALEAVGQHGALRGSALAAWRLCRCQPFGGSGFDPVPPIPPSSPAPRRAKANFSCDSVR